MSVDARKLQDSFLLEADLCIVGSGAAGIPLALAFDDSKISILLLEAGGFAKTDEDQDLYKGEYAGNVPSLDGDYLTYSRLRYFGGTTNHWGGYCRPLETIDFEKRDWVPHSGWPFTKAELNPYYRQASKFLDLGRFDQENPDSGDEQLPDIFSDELFQGKVYRFKALRFGPVHRERLDRSRNIRLVHHANVVEIITNETGRTVERLRIETLSGKRGAVRAKAFVLAMGAIENCRMLLASADQQSHGVGNQNDLVGRYFMEHPVTHTGMGPLFMWPELSTDLYQLHGGPGRHRLQMLYLRDSQLRKRRMLTIAAELYRAKATDLIKFEFSEFDRAIMRTSFDSDHLPSPGGGYAEPQTFHTVSMCEQEPNPESRVTLTMDRDALGVRRVRLAWNLTGFELRTIFEFAELLRRKVSAAGWGRIKNPSDPEALLRVMSKGSHHMGTTRMHDNPKRGVVDPECRVHGIDNLYIAGSSVFPTSGAANPTFTILALALRMADHLKQRLGAS